jgi:hypothetical protein
MAYAMLSTYSKTIVPLAAAGSAGYNAVFRSARWNAGALVACRLACSCTLVPIRSSRTLLIPPVARGTGMELWN